MNYFIYKTPIPRKSVNPFVVYYSKFSGLVCLKFAH